MINRSRLSARTLAAVFRLPVPTRKTIAEHLDISHVTLGKALQELEAAGDISSSEAILSTGSGRPSEVFSVRPDVLYGIGIYIQPDGARAVLIDAGKRGVGEWSLALPSRYRQLDEVERVLQDVLEWSVERASVLVDPERIGSVAFSVPGFVDTDRCVWTAGLQFGRFTDLDVRALLSNRFPVAIHIEDTSRSLTHFQLMHEETVDPTGSFIVINLGIGLGAGIVVDGSVFFGNGGIAGEIGHIPLANNTNRCACGNVGCTETMLSATGIRSVFHQRLQQGVRSDLNDRPNPSGPPSIREILDSADGGDHFTRNTLHELGSMLGDLTDIVLKCHTPGPIVLAGEGALLSAYLIPSMKQTLGTKVLPEMLKHFSVVVQPYISTNEAMGAGYLGMMRTLLRQVNK